MMELCFLIRQLRKQYMRSIDRQLAFHLTGPRADRSVCIHAMTDRSARSILAFSKRQTLHDAKLIFLLASGDRSRHASRTIAFPAPDRLRGAFPRKHLALEPRRCADAPTPSSPLDVQFVHMVVSRPPGERGRPPENHAIPRRFAATAVGSRHHRSGCGRCIGHEEVWRSSWLLMMNPGSAPTSDAACTRDATVLAITISRTADRCRHPLAPREPSHPARFA